MTIPVGASGDFSSLITDVLLAGLQRGELHMMLAQPPLVPAGAIRITPMTQPLLKVNRGRRVNGGLLAWPRLGLEAKPTPFLAIVLEGTADLSIGVTERMALDERITVKNGLYHLRLPPQHMLIHPAGVPHSDGRRPHWESKTEEQPDCTILWLDVLPEGAHLHNCHTRKGQHMTGESRFVVDSRLPLIFDSMIEELQLGSEDGSGRAASFKIASLLLEVLLLRVARSLARQKAHKISPSILEREGDADTSENSWRSASPSPLNRARDFIQGRLSQRLSVAMISHHALVSPAQLNRLFRAEMGQSVMEYVNDQRLMTAKSLLINTGLPIGTIGTNVGVPSPVYFSRLFREKTGMTPQQYRTEGVEP